MSLENRRILLKGNSEKTINQEGALLNFYSINENWFTINEKYTHAIS